MKMSLRSKVVIYALLVMVAIYFLSPFVYMLFSTFKTSAEAIAYPPSLFPKEWQWENYAKAWDAQPFGKYLLNSVIVTVLNTLGTVLSCSLVAYGFARYNFKGKNILFMILLSTMMIPWDVTMIPQYMEFKAFGWINTLLPLIVPSFFGSAYYIFLMRQFLLGVPKEYDGGCAHRRLQRPADLVEGVHAHHASLSDSGGCAQHDHRMERLPRTAHLPAGPQQVHAGVGLGLVQGRAPDPDHPDAVHHRGDDHPARGCVPFRPEVHRRRYLRFHQVIPLAGQGWLSPIARSLLWSPELFPGRMMPPRTKCFGPSVSARASAPKPHQGV